MALVSSMIRSCGFCLSFGTRVLVRSGTARSSRACRRPMTREGARSAWSIALQPLLFDGSSPGGKRLPGGELDPAARAPLQVCSDARHVGAVERAVDVRRQ